MTMWPSRTRCGRHGQGGQDGERLEGDLVGRLRDGVEVIEHPQRLEAERPRPAARARSSGPRRRPASQPSYSPFQPCGAINPTCIRHSRHALPPPTRPRRSMVTVRPKPSPRRARRARAGRAAAAAVRRRLSSRPAAGADDDRPSPTFDPSAPLAGPPDPWDSAPTPSWRAGPPYHMTDMIAAEPALAGGLIDATGGAGPAADLAAAIRATLTAGEPVVVTGCGTSEHGALAAVEILREAAAAAGLDGASVTSEQAFELSLAPPARGLVIGISHEGATARHERRARRGAGRPARRPPSSRSAAARRPAPLAGIVVETGELDQGWCHTVGYLSPILAAAAVGAHLSGRPLDAGDGRRPARRRDARRRRRGADRGARSPTPRTSWSSRPGRTGRPAASSCSRSRRRPGCRPPTATSRRSCTATCRPPARAPGLVLILADRDRRAERLARARQALAAAQVIGLRAAAIVAAGGRCGARPGLTPAGRLLVAEAPDLPARSRRWSGRATPLQLLTERLARARGTNPDLIRRDDPVYLAARRDAAGRLSRGAGDGDRRPPRPARRGPRPSRRSCRGPRAGSPGA